MTRLRSFFTTIISVISICFLSSFTNKLSADINVTIPGIEIITTGSFNVDAAGGTIAVQFVGTADVNEINSYLSSKNLDFLYVYTMGSDELMIEIEPNTSDIPVVIGVSGRLGGYISIIQDCY
ncbi:MAG: hypothetical protein IJN06_02430 [Bacteroidales bacterium]|nr:hypothetical protein [Bacteroidales bacterium]MBQ7017845.1 hypothetical protein [Bacteroidales bacterium]